MSDQSLDQQASEFLANSDSKQTETIDTEAAAAGEAKTEAAPEKPKTPQEEIAEAKASKAEAEKMLSEAKEKLAKVNSQFGAHARKQRALDEREAKVIEREKALSSVSSVEEIANYLAKARNVTLDEIWKEWSDEIQKGGPSPELQLKREREAFAREKAEREQRDKEAAERASLEARQREGMQYGAQIDATMADPAFATSFPRISAQPRTLIERFMVGELNSYHSQTGTYPDPQEFLQWVESTLPEAPTAQPKPKISPRLPTSKDAASAPNTRGLSEAERDRLALEFLANNA